MIEKQIEKEQTMNEKNLKIVRLLPAALMLAIAACSPLQDETPPGGNEQVELIVGDVSIADAGSTTRNTTITTGKLWLSILNANGYAGRRGLVYECNGGVWTCPTSVILNSTNFIVLYVYYPQDKFSVNGDVIRFSVQKYSADNDLCYAIGAKKNVHAGNPVASFALKHAYTRIRLSITREAAFTGTGNITAYNLKAATGSINLDCSKNLQSGTWSSGNPSTTGYTIGLSTTVTAGTANTACDMLVPPQLTPADGFTITLTIDGNARSVTIPKDKFENTLEENTQYTVHLEIGANATLIPGTIDEVEWSAPTDLGEIEHLVTQ